MRPGALALLFSGIVALFVVVWGGGYLWLQSRRAKPEPVAVVPPKPTEETKPPVQVPIPPPAKKHEKPKAEVEKPNRDKDRQRQKVIDSFTVAERRIHDAIIEQLPSKPIADIETLANNDGVSHMIRHVDFYGRRLIETKLEEYADSLGADGLVGPQNIQDRHERLRVKFGFCLLKRSSRNTAVRIAEKAGTQGLSSLSARDRAFIEANEILFPKFK